MCNVIFEPPRFAVDYKPAPSTLTTIRRGGRFSYRQKSR